MKWLIYGRGWISGIFCELLEKDNETIIYAESRADDEKAVEEELINVKPDRVVSLIGRTSGPGFNTIDYLEQKGKLVENIRDNLYGPMVLAILCTKYGIHLSYLGTGCIYDGAKGDTGNGYSDDAKPDFFGSAYSTVKGYTHRFMHFFETNVLSLKLRMPICDTTNKRNFITKIMTYQKIASTSNSMSVLPELLPLMIDMAKNKVTGAINFTNPGVISHNEILEMVKEIYDPTFTWENFTIEEQDKILLAGRSNNMLNTAKLESLYPNVLNIKDAVRKVIQQMKINKDNSLNK